MTTYELLKSATEDKTADPKLKFFLKLQQFTLGFLTSSEFEDLSEDKPTLSKEDWQKEFDAVVAPLVFYPDQEDPNANILYPNTRKFIQDKATLLTYALDNDIKHLFSKKDYLDNSSLTLVGELPHTEDDTEVIYPVFDCRFFEDRGFVYDDKTDYMFSRTYQPLVLENQHVVENCILCMLTKDFYETDVPTIYAQSVDHNGAQFTCHVIPVKASEEVKKAYALPLEVNTLLCVVAYKNGFNPMDVISYVDFEEYEALVK